MDQAFGKMSDAEKKSQIKKVCPLAPAPAHTQVNGIFQLDVKSAAGKQVTWVIDLKENGTVTKGPAKKAGAWAMLGAWRPPAAAPCFRNRGNHTDPHRCHRQHE